MTTTLILLKTLALTILMPIASALLLLHSDFVPRYSSEKSSTPTDPARRSPASTVEGSVYALDSMWQTQDGRSLALGELAGQVRVVTMGYSTCQFTCPRLVADLRRVESALSPEARKAVGFVFVSIDPETDTPEQLRDYAARNGFDSDHWMLLTGNEDTVLELAVTLGMRFRQTSEKDYAHSNLITVLDPAGEILYQRLGLEEELDEILDAIESAILDFTKIP